jgi:hypothetical protein
MISPLLSLIVTLTNFRSKGAKNLLWAFVVFYGVTMVIPGEGADSYVSKMKTRKEVLIFFIP